MHFMDFAVFSLIFGIPVLIVVEFFVFISGRRSKSEKASRARMIREMSRKHHPSNWEGEE